MMKVVCFYWQGDRWQQKGYKQPKGHTNLQQDFMKKAGLVSDDLPSQYVNNLHRGIKRFANQEFEFVCFTNEEMQLDEGITVKPFPIVSKHGVLPRLYMFSEESGLFGHQVLCLDLDIVITGSLEDIMNYRGEFCTRLRFRGNQGLLDGDIMSFNACKETEEKFWKPFIQDIKGAEQLTKGRERYWVRHVLGNKADNWGKEAPNQIFSYKNHMRKTKKLPNDARIVSCHGVPRPHEIKDNWIKQYWI